MQGVVPMIGVLLRGYIVLSCLFLALKFVTRRFFGSVSNTGVVLTIFYFFMNFYIAFGCLSCSGKYGGVGMGIYVYLLTAIFPGRLIWRQFVRLNNTRFWMRRVSCFRLFTT